MGNNRRSRHPQNQSRHAPDDSVGMLNNYKGRLKGKSTKTEIEIAKTSFDFNAALQEVDGDGGGGNGGVPWPPHRSRQPPPLVPRTRVRNLHH